MFSSIFGKKNTSSESSEPKPSQEKQKSHASDKSHSSSLGWQAAKVVGNSAWWVTKNTTKVAAKGAAKGAVWATKQAVHAATQPSKQAKLESTPEPLPVYIPQPSFVPYPYPASYSAPQSTVKAEEESEENFELAIEKFLSLFEAFKQKTIDKISDEEISLLFDMAQQAQIGGYLDAFYDIGEYLSSKDCSPRQAYKRVSPESVHYQDACINAAEFEFAKALQSEISFDKLDHIKSSLKFSLKISNKTLCRSYIQKNAQLYIKEKINNGEKGIDIEKILQNITPDTKVDDLFKQFDALKKELPENAAIKSLEEENLKLRTTFMLSAQFNKQEEVKEEKEEKLEVKGFEIKDPLIKKNTL